LAGTNECLVDRIRKTKSKQMTTGALVFAFNNEQTNYIRMAAWSSRNIKRHLKIPVALVTNDKSTAKKYNFDQIIIADAESGGTRYFEDYDKSVTWHNASRTDAYALTPWDQTLVLDADYVVASNQLKTVLTSRQDFLAHGLAYDIVAQDDFVGLNHYGNYHMPMSWATVMMFRQSEHAELIFDCMQMIKSNWKHYIDLYQTRTTTYRNDYALSIALNIVSGQTLQHPAIPWSLASLLPQHTVTRTGPDQYRVDHEQRSRWITLKNQDFHAMGKKHLEKIIETN
jgi:hypothetical protein